MAEAKEFVVSLKPVMGTVKSKRARRSITHINRFLFKHFRAKKEQVVISNALNSEIWRGGPKKIPRKVEIQVLEDEGFYRVFLKGEKLPQKKKEKAKEKKEAKAASKKEEKEKQEDKEEEELEQKKKLEEKKEKEKAAEKAAMKRGKGK